MRASHKNENAPRLRYNYAPMRRFLLLLILLLVPMRSAVAQSEVAILDVDSADFPAITLTFSARDAQGNGLDPLPALQLFENDQPIPITDVQTLPTGVDVTFVIDNNRTIGGIDLIGDVSRLEKVKQTIGTYVEQYTGLGLDRVTVIAGQDDAALFLVEDAADAETVKDALAAYNPDPLPREAPIETMLLVAFEQAAAREPTSRYQAIVLFSDAEFLAEQVNFFDVREVAQRSDAVFFAGILGKFASDDEIENVNELIIPTGGAWVHMPQPEDFSEIAETIDSNGLVRQLRFRSEVREGGTQQLRLNVGDQIVEASYDVEILEPEILFLMEERPIMRSPDPDNPTEITPNRQQVRARVVFPDDHPRGLENVRFFVNGLEQRFFNPPVYDESGLLTFDWGIRSAETGEYNLIIELTDELGLTVRSQPFTQQVILRTQNEPTPEPTAIPPTPTLIPAPLQPAIDQAQRAIDSGFVTAALAVIALGLLVVLLMRIRKRRQERAVDSAETPTIIVPTPTPELPDNVFIEWQREEGGEKQLFPINSTSVYVGSDPFRADIILTDDSVSRRHAHIVFEENRFVLHDEESAYGTRVNFEPVNLRAQPIKNGDQLQFGSVRTTFRIFTEDQLHAES